MHIEIRPEAQADISAIERLTTTAFLHAPHARHTEQFIVNALRIAKQLSISLVAENEAGIVGHVALSSVSISDGASDWYGLGPISVLSTYQGQGIGAELVKSALSELRRMGAAGCVVLGDPAYYHRFGFLATPALLFPGVPAEYFQAISLNDSWPSGKVSYHPAFNAVA